AGVEMKDRLVAELKKMGFNPDDVGSKDPDQPDDYPDFAHPVAKEISEGQAKRGILLCGSGVGMDIVANRYPGVRAALAWDPEIARFIDLEVERQRHGLELIASENFASPAVLEAMGTPLTNKYAEGLPGKRYYGGCEFVDMVEQLAIDRLKKLFDADHANVQ